MYVNIFTFGFPCYFCEISKGNYASLNAMYSSETLSIFKRIFFCVFWFNSDRHVAIYKGSFSLKWQFAPKAPSPLLNSFKGKPRGLRTKCNIWKNIVMSYLNYWIMNSSLRHPFIGLNRDIKETVVIFAVKLLWKCSNESVCQTVPI